jgi:glutamate racemase
MTICNNPIGIFDSGIGGLSHAKAIADRLPHQSLIYIGDIQHFPYGTKTQEELISYCLPIVEYLLNQGCEIIVIACNTASSAAAQSIRDWVGDRAMVLDVISLIVDYAALHCSNQKLGLIGTDYTINSQVYEKALFNEAPSIQLSSIATPELIYHIETEINTPNEKRTKCYDALIHQYLSVNALQNIQALILACTHYPFVKERINRYYNNQIPLIDSANLVAERLEKELKGTPDTKSQKIFYCTQRSDAFNEAAESFFKQKTELLVL